MNRSIFQIWQPFKLFNILYAVIISLFIFFYLSIYNNVFCSNLKGISEFSKYALIESNYHNFNFLKSKTINDQNSNLGLDMFLNYINNKNNLNYQISKYYLNNNGLLLPFEKKSPYNHPNLFLGNWNSIYFNYQFSHNKFSNNFNLFSRKDLYGDPYSQYLNFKLYMYDINLSQIMLNHNSLNHNNQFLPLNKNLINASCVKSEEIQLYLHENTYNFEEFINVSLKNNY